MLWSFLIFPFFFLWEAQVRYGGNALIGEDVCLVFEVQISYLVVFPGKIDRWVLTFMQERLSTVKQASYFPAFVFWLFRLDKGRGTYSVARYQVPRILSIPMLLNFRFYS
ncbi:hypothetical protein RND81_01G153800 [Saponaria officinalis]|uniref:Secreted protein n=1 Tax=Saponaria officinalis TaxID=3572 RepID=A0AAW1N7X0_SAPOF